MILNLQPTDDEVRQDHAAERLAEFIRLKELHAKFSLTGSTAHEMIDPCPPTTNPKD